MHAIDIPVVSDLVVRGFTRISDNPYSGVHARLTAEVQKWCEDHIGPIEWQNFRHIGFESDVIFEEYDTILDSALDVITVKFSSFGDFLAFKMRWL